MNFKKNWKRFWTLSSAREGFTLVELIVVIAILAILAGVAVPAYSGYVTKANKQADMTMVSDIIHAAQLAMYASEGFSGSQSIILTATGSAQLQGTDTTWLDTALKNVYGDNYAETLKLKYTNWGVGGAMTETVLGHFSSYDASSPLYGIYTGELSPTFANEVDDLFVLMRDIANDIGNGEGAELVKGAANLTANGAITADQFAEYWATEVWDSEYLMGSNSGDYGENATQLEGDILNQAIANAAVIKARNTALANYLKNQYPDDEDIASVCDMIENYTFGSSVVPADFAGTFLSDSGENDQNFQIIDAAIGQLENGEEFFVSMLNYYDNSNGQSLAEIDGLAYFAMMDTVDTTAGSPALEGATDAEYWDAMSGAVNLYGSIARNEAELTDLQNALSNAPMNSIVIVFMSDGSSLVINVNPGSVLSN